MLLAISIVAIVFGSLMLKASRDPFSAVGSGDREDMCTIGSALVLIGFAILFSITSSQVGIPPRMPY